MFIFALCMRFVLIHIGTFNNARFPWEVSVIPGDRGKLPDSGSFTVKAWELAANKKKTSAQKHTLINKTDSDLVVGF